MGVGKIVQLTSWRVTKDGFQSHIDTSLRCLKFGIALLQWMIVGLISG